MALYSNEYIGILIACIRSNWKMDAIGILTCSFHLPIQIDG